jgi:hypothetical protein
MAGVGAYLIVVDRGLSFVWWAVCESTHPLSFYATSGSRHREPYFYARSGG